MQPRSPREMAILDAALDLVTEVGFDCVSMDAVASRAKASKATIYRHWAGKAELVADAMRCRVCIDLDVPDQGSLRADLLAITSMMSDAMAGTDGRLMLGLLAAKERDPELGRLLREQLYEAKRPLWQVVSDRAQARGELPDAAIATDALAEVIPSLAFLQQAVLGLPLDEAWRVRIVDTIVVPLVAGTVPAPSPA